MQRIEMEGISLLATFPEEVWILIFDKFCRKSKQAFINTSLFFRNLFRTRSAVDFFTPVWHLVSAFELNQLPISIREGPIPQSHIDLQSPILKCRLVCRLWFQIVDTCLQNFASNYLNIDKSFHFDRRNAMDISCALQLIPRISRDPNILQHFRDTHPVQKKKRSPIITNAAHFYMENTEIVCATLYGAHIFHCKFNRVCYEILCQILQHLPNLQTLNCWTYFQNDPQEELRQRELPPLPTLRNLTAFTTQPGMLIELLRKYGSSLDYLCVPKPAIDTLPAGFQCPKLKVFKTEVNYEAQLKILDVALEAETISIGFDPVFYDSSWPLFYIIKHLNQNIPPTCHTLVVSLGKQHMPEERITVRLNLKSVRRIKIYLRSWISLDFLLGLQTTLETLWVQVDRQWEMTDSEEVLGHPWMADFMEMEEIKFLSCYKNMEQSNIWELFPRLKFVRIETVGYEVSSVMCWKRKKDTQGVKTMEQFGFSVDSVR